MSRAEASSAAEGLACAAEEAKVRMSPAVAGAIQARRAIVSLSLPRKRFLFRLEPAFAGA